MTKFLSKLVLAFLAYTAVSLLVSSFRGSKVPAKKVAQGEPSQGNGFSWFSSSAHDSSDVACDVEGEEHEGLSPCSLAKFALKFVK